MLKSFKLMKQHFINLNLFVQKIDILKLHFLWLLKSKIIISNLSYLIYSDVL